MKKAKPKQPQLDLGEIAAGLMQAQVSETAALTELRDALLAFVNGKAGVDCSLSVKKLATAAQSKLDALLSGEAPDAEQALAAAARLACLATSPEAEPTADAELDWEQPPIVPAAAAESAVHCPTLVPADPDTELIVEFLTEANEHVVNAEAALLTLEEQPEDAAAVNTVFRAF